ncbi:MAG TPA: hypothetical protein VL485_01795 [Ktedonobacteraceae bacterium]|nr:hypothetical protein [Ktedonobacteraceae bacterium]
MMDKEIGMYRVVGTRIGMRRTRIGMRRTRIGMKPDPYLCGWARLPGGTDGSFGFPGIYS